MKVLISGGGTGGHIFPAIAIAQEIKKRIPNAEFLFIGAEGKMEMEKVPPLSSSMPILPAWARLPKSAMVCSIWWNESWSALRMTGTTRPRGEPTATPMSK